MKKVYIIHGFGGVPNGGWFPWLMRELAKESIFACSLPMPNTNNPNVTEWVEAIGSYIGEPSKDTIIVGHSLGVPAILRYLESLKSGTSIGGILLVSGFIEPLETENPKSEFRKIDNFVNPPINFEKIKNISHEAIVLHGAKDLIVPFYHAEKISKGLECKLIKIENGDHFSQKIEPICYELPEVLEALNEMTK
ncbi:MAG: alpha/beta hydrolase [Patescibacteria group bacterium]